MDVDGDVILVGASVDDGHRVVGHSIAWVLGARGIDAKALLGMVEWQPIEISRQEVDGMPSRLAAVDGHGDALTVLDDFTLGSCVGAGGRAACHERTWS